MTNGSDRNTECGCGSGLKMKKCHSDPMFQQAATNIARGMVQLFVTQRMHERDLLDGDTTEDAIKNIVGQINDYLPECVELNTAYEVEEAPEQDTVPIDKLVEKENEGNVLESIQQGTALCGCGRRLPVGMTCAKCNSSEANNE